MRLFQLLLHATVYRRAVYPVHREPGVRRHYTFIRRITLRASGFGCQLRYCGVATETSC